MSNIINIQENIRKLNKFSEIIMCLLSAKSEQYTKHLIIIF